MMTLEITIPEDWTPGQALAMRALLQHAILNNNSTPRRLLPSSAKTPRLTSSKRSMIALRR